MHLGFSARGQEAAAVDAAAAAVVAVAATMRVDRIITILKSQPRRGMRSSVVAFNEKFDDRRVPITR
jgi:hypothetical protein